ncbi:MAG: YbaK/EbsC family protein [Synergistaceae bacterium]|jgi:prolyl-tRNA editing enzyme YbaK/EbsC (Cys-tRNA(Pro) deacylase)|nr:YbaK/EbsC family protein [Synergistaceae bacterium]
MREPTDAIEDVIEDAIEEAIEKVRVALDAGGYGDIEIKVTEETIFTVEDATRAVGAPAEKILKSLVFLVDERPVLVLMSGANRVDLRAVAREAKGKKTKMASPEYVFERFGFKVGGVPPTGYPIQIPAFLDEDLFRYPVVWAAAGTDHAFFPIEPERLLALTGGMKVPIKKRGFCHDPSPDHAS